jgi:hypothetical protein
MSALLELGFGFLLFWKIVPDGEGEMRDDFTWLHVFMPLIIGKSLICGVRGLILIESLTNHEEKALSLDDTEMAGDFEHSEDKIDSFKEVGAHVDDASIAIKPMINPDAVVAFTFFINGLGWLAWRVLLYIRLADHSAKGRWDKSNIFLPVWISIVVGICVISALFRPVVVKEIKKDGRKITKIYRMGHLEAFTCAFNSMVWQLVLVILLEEKLVMGVGQSWGFVLITLWLFAVVLIVISLFLSFGMTCFHLNPETDFSIGGVTVPQGYAKCLSFTVAAFLIPMAVSFLVFLVCLTDTLDGKHHYSTKTILIPLLTYFATKAALVLVGDLLLDHWEHNIHAKEAHTTHHSAFAAPNFRASVGGTRLDDNGNRMVPNVMEQIPQQTNPMVRGEGPGLQSLPEEEELDDEGLEANLGETTVNPASVTTLGETRSLATMI